MVFTFESIAMPGSKKEEKSTETACSTPGKIQRAPGSGLVVETNPPRVSSSHILSPISPSEHSIGSLLPAVLSGNEEADVDPNTLELVSQYIDQIQGNVNTSTEPSHDFDGTMADDGLEQTLLSGSISMESNDDDLDNEMLDNVRRYIDALQRDTNFLSDVKAFVSGTAGDDHLDSSPVQYKSASSPSENMSEKTDIFEEMAAEEMPSSAEVVERVGQSTRKYLSENETDCEEKKEGDSVILPQLYGYETSGSPEMENVAPTDSDDMAVTRAIDAVTIRPDATSNSEPQEQLSEVVESCSVQDNSSHQEDGLGPAKSSETETRPVAEGSMKEERSSSSASLAQDERRQPRAENTPREIEASDPSSNIPVVEGIIVDLDPPQPLRIRPANSGIELISGPSESSQNLANDSMMESESIQEIGSARSDPPSGIDAPTDSDDVAVTKAIDALTIRPDPSSNSESQEHLTEVVESCSTQDNSSRQEDGLGPATSSETETPPVAEGSMKEEGSSSLASLVLDEHRKSSALNIPRELETQRESEPNRTRSDPPSGVPLEEERTVDNDPPEQLLGSIQPVTSGIELTPGPSKSSQDASDGDMIDPEQFKEIVRDLSGELSKDRIQQDEEKHIVPEPKEPVANSISDPIDLTQFSDFDGDYSTALQDDAIHQALAEKTPYFEADSFASASKMQSELSSTSLVVPKSETSASHVVTSTVESSCSDALSSSSGPLEIATEGANSNQYVAPLFSDAKNADRVQQRKLPDARPAKERSSTPMLNENDSTGIAPDDVIGAYPSFSKKVGPTPEGYLRRKDGRGQPSGSSAEAGQDCLQQKHEVKKSNEVVRSDSDLYHVDEAIESSRHVDSGAPGLTEDYGSTFTAEQENLQQEHAGNEPDGVIRSDSDLYHVDEAIESSRDVDSGAPGLTEDYGSSFTAEQEYLQQEHAGNEPDGVIRSDSELHHVDGAIEPSGDVDIGSTGLVEYSGSSAEVGQEHIQQEHEGEEPDIVGRSVGDFPPEDGAIESSPAVDSGSLGLTEDFCPDSEPDRLSALTSDPAVTELAQRLYSDLQSSSEWDYSQYCRFKEFAIVCFQYFYKKEPTDDEIALVLNVARSMDLSQKLTDDFVAKAISVQDARSRDSYPEPVLSLAPSDELLEAKSRSKLTISADPVLAVVVDFLTQLVEWGHSKGAAHDDDVEFELDSGFVDEENARGYTGVDDSPWWVINERVESEEAEESSTSLGDRHTIPSDAQCSAKLSKEDSLRHSVEKDVRDFWQEQAAIDKEKPRVSHRYPFNRVSGVYGHATPSADSVQQVPNSVSGKKAARELWLERRSMAIWTKNKAWATGQHAPWASKPEQIILKVDDPSPIDGTNAASKLFRPVPARRLRDGMPTSEQWRLPYKHRIRANPGYYNVDAYSIYGASAVGGDKHPLDELPWEHREVKQRFLHEQSVQFTRNWFGSVQLAKGNDLYSEPVTAASSMKMPMKAGAWSEQWFEKQSQPVIHSIDTEELGHAIMRTNALQRRPYPCSLRNEDDEDEEWERPECGTLRNTKLRVGERISRVTPDFTSSLRRSRWRKKHFPRGAFPYE